MNSKFIFTPLLLCIGLIPSFGQIVAVENTRHNAIYPSMDNQLKVVVEQVPCDELYITTDNGMIVSRGNCQYVLKPNLLGTASIFIHRISAKDTTFISEKKYRVKSWPIPRAEIGSKKSGRMSLPEFKAQRGISVPILNFDISGYHSLETFKMFLIRDSELIDESMNEGGRFELNTRKLIDIVRIGDTIVFDKIMIFMPGEEEAIELEEIRILIKE